MTAEHSSVLGPGRRQVGSSKRGARARGRGEKRREERVGEGEHGGAEARLLMMDHGPGQMATADRCLRQRSLAAPALLDDRQEARGLRCVRWRWQCDLRCAALLGPAAPCCALLCSGCGSAMAELRAESSGRGLLTDPTAQCGTIQLLWPHSLPHRAATTPPIHFSLPPSPPNPTPASLSLHTHPANLSLPLLSYPPSPHPPLSPSPPPLPPPPPPLCTLSPPPPSLPPQPPPPSASPSSPPLPCAPSASL